jgi:hypothetical protein
MLIAEPGQPLDPFKLSDSIRISPEQRPSAVARAVALLSV